MKLFYTKREVEQLKDELFLNDEEELLLIMWISGKSMVEISMMLHISTATVSRRKKELLDKIKKFYD